MAIPCRCNIYTFDQGPYRQTTLDYFYPISAPTMVPGSIWGGVLNDPSTNANFPGYSSGNSTEVLNEGLQKTCWYIENTNNDISNLTGSNSTNLSWEAGSISPALDPVLGGFHFTAGNINMASISGSKDDYLFTSAILFQTGVTYTLKYAVYTYTDSASVNSEQKLEVKLATLDTNGFPSSTTATTSIQTAAEVKTAVIAAGGVTGSTTDHFKTNTSLLEISDTFTVSSDTVGTIAFHALSANLNILTLKNIEIEPSAYPTLTVSPNVTATIGNETCSKNDGYIFPIVDGLTTADCLWCWEDGPTTADRASLSAGGYTVWIVNKTTGYFLGQENFNINYTCGNLGPNEICRDEEIALEGSKLLNSMNLGQDTCISDSIQREMIIDVWARLKTTENSCLTAAYEDRFSQALFNLCRNCTNDVSAFSMQCGSFWEEQGGLIWNNGNTGLPDLGFQCCWGTVAYAVGDVVSHNGVLWFQSYNQGPGASENFFSEPGSTVDTTWVECGTEVAYNPDGTQRSMSNPYAELSKESYRQGLIEYESDRVNLFKVKPGESKSTIELEDGNKLCGERGGSRSQKTNFDF